MAASSRVAGRRNSLRTDAASRRASFDLSSKALSARTAKQTSLRARAWACVRRVRTSANLPPPIRMIAGRRLIRTGGSCGLWAGTRRRNGPSWSHGSPENPRSAPRGLAAGVAGGGRAAAGGSDAAGLAAVLRSAGRRHVVSSSAQDDEAGRECAGMWYGMRRRRRRAGTNEAHVPVYVRD